MSRESLSPSRREALALVFGAFAVGISPDPVMTVSQWADAARVVAAESSPKPGKWDTALVPYLREIMDCLSPCVTDVREVTFKKSAQVAGTEAGINLFGLIAARAPAPMLIVLPTIDEAKKYVDVKLQPAIDATPELSRKVRELRSRSERGSTTMKKKFPGGFCQITGANSSKGLQMISVKIVIREEISEWPIDVDGRGDPMDLSEARTFAFTKDKKLFNNSTPGIKGMCRISAKYEASDKRRYYVQCPHCAHLQVLRWEQLVYSTTFPHNATYTCEADGCSKPIEHHQKAKMLKEGRWISTAPGPGRHPGFAINALYSPFLPWDEIVKLWIAAKGDPVKEKVFTQQVLGEAYEAKGEAPDYLKLQGRLEAYRLGRVLPYGVLFLTLGADVQGDRIEWAVWGWGIGKTSWLVDKGIVQGDTADLATWSRFAPVLAKQYLDWQGKAWPIEAVAVDSGFNTQAVYTFVRGAGERVMAVKGMPGHLSPALGTPTQQEVNWEGKRIRAGVILWPVGTWTLKAEFYANLRKTIAGPNEDGLFPIGYVHLPTEIDELYLQQLTAEYLVTHDRKGFQVQEWTKSKDARNEALDCRIYAGAAAVHLGLDRMAPEDWLRLAANRGAPVDVPQGDFASMWAPAVAPERPADAPVALVMPAPEKPASENRGEEQSSASGGGDWISGGSDWLRN